MAHFSGLPFDDILNLVASLPISEPIIAENELEKLTGWYQRFAGKKNITKPFCVLFFTSHGFETPLAKVKTREMLEQAGQGNANINKLCAHFDIGLKAFDLAIDHPTKNILEADAFAENECAATIAYGMEAIAGEPDLVILSASSEGGEIVAKGILESLPHSAKPLELLRVKGGREIAAMLGSFIAARLQNVPVIADGLEAKAAIALLEKLRGDAIHHILTPKNDYSREAGVNGIMQAGAVKAALVLV